MTQFAPPRSDSMEPDDLAWTRSARGRQELIYDTKFNALAGTTLPPGTYQYWLDTPGCSTVEIHLLATSLGGGACAADAYYTFSDHVTKKGASFTGAGNLVASTRLTLTSPAGSAGAQKVLLQLTVTGGTGVVFSSVAGSAEWNAL